MRFVFIHEETTYTLAYYFSLFFFIFVRFRFVLAASIFRIVSDRLNVIIIKDTLFFVQIDARCFITIYVIFIITIIINTISYTTQELRHVLL